MLDQLDGAVAQPAVDLIEDIPHRIHQAPSPVARAKASTLRARRSSTTVCLAEIRRRPTMERQKFVSQSVSTSDHCRHKAAISLGDVALRHRRGARDCCCGAGTAGTITSLQFKPFAFSMECAVRPAAATSPSWSDPSMPSTFTSLSAKAGERDAAAVTAPPLRQRAECDAALA